VLQVITDAVTGRSKGYGFVRFSAEAERNRALTEMNGHFLSNRPIRVSLATARKNPAPMTTVQTPHPSDFDPTNTTLFIGGLSATITEEQLRDVFGRFGDIIYVKIPQGKGCGFVQFVLRISAEQALSAMNGQVLGSSSIRISWGRSSSRAATQTAQLVGLSGIPPGAGAGAGFHTQGFGDAALLAAAGAYAPHHHFGPGHPGGMHPSADPYAAAFAAGAPPLDMFAGFVPGMTGFGGVPPEAAIANGIFNNGNAPAPPSINGNGMLPPVTTAIVGGTDGSSGPPSSASNGTAPTSGINQLSASPPKACVPADPLLSNSNGNTSTATIAAQGEMNEANGTRDGYVPSKVGHNAAILGTHLFASLLG